MPTVREEIVNENLAQILEHYLRDVSAETIVYASGHHERKTPDVRVSIDGVTIIIEARFGRARLEEDAQAREEIFDYIESFYNRQRRHSSLGYLSPAVFEAGVT